MTQILDHFIQEAFPNFSWKSCESFPWISRVSYTKFLEAVIHMTHSESQAEQHKWLIPPGLSPARWSEWALLLTGGVSFG